MARPFQSFPKPLFQSKAEYKASDRKVSFYSDEDETYYHKKDLLSQKGFTTEQSSWEVEFFFFGDVLHYALLARLSKMR